MDLIDRQDAINAVEVLHGGCITNDVKNFVRYQLLSVPSAPRWIPVTERLPEEEKDVLCFTIHQTMLVASYGKLYPLSDEVGWITNEYNRLDVSSVLAWMPLPKPWKGE